MPPGKGDVPPDGPADNRQDRVEVNLGRHKGVANGRPVRDLHDRQRVQEDQDGDDRQHLDGPVDGLHGVFHHKDQDGGDGRNYGVPNVELDDDVDDDTRQDGETDVQ